MKKKVGFAQEQVFPDDDIDVEEPSDDESVSDISVNDEMLNEDFDLQMLEVLDKIRSNDSSVKEASLDPKKRLSLKEEELKNKKQKMLQELEDEEDGEEEAPSINKDKLGKDIVSNALRSKTNLSKDQLFLRKYLLDNLWRDELLNSDLNIADIEEEQRKLDELEDNQNKVFAESITPLDGYMQAVPKKAIEESEREPKISRKKKQRLARNSKFKEKLKDQEDTLSQQRKQLQDQFYDLLSEYKQLIQGTETVIDKLPMDSSNWDWDAHIDINPVIHEFSEITEEDMEEENSAIFELKKKLKKKYDEYCSTFFDEFRSGFEVKARFRYKPVASEMEKKKGKKAATKEDDEDDIVNILFGDELAKGNAVLTSEEPVDFSKFLEMDDEELKKMTTAQKKVSKKEKLKKKKKLIKPPTESINKKRTMPQVVEEDASSSSEAPKTKKAKVDTTSTTTTTQETVPTKQEETTDSSVQPSKTKKRGTRGNKKKKNGEEAQEE